ncbi:hypothetical protein ACQJBY_035678 [Aegilops geniculata]
MEEEQERVGGLHAEPAASGMRPPPSRRCAGAVCRHCRSCVFQVYPADRRGPLVPDKPTGINLPQRVTTGVTAPHDQRGSTRIKMRLPCQS